MNVKQRMEEIQVNSYRDCVWYNADLDRCIMFKMHDEYTQCDCKDTMRDLCVWITKFLKSSSKEEPSEDCEELYMRYSKSEPSEEELLKALNSLLEPSIIYGA